MDGLLPGAPVMATARGLAVDGDEIDPLGPGRPVAIAADTVMLPRSRDQTTTSRSLTVRLLSQRVARIIPDSRHRGL